MLDSEGTLRYETTVAKWLQYTLEFLWLATLFFLPLLFSPLPEAGFEITKVIFFQAIVSAMLLVWILKMFFEKNVSYNFRPVFSLAKKYRFLALFFAIFVIANVSATVFSINPEVSFFGSSSRFQGLYTFICYLLFGLILLLNIRVEKQMQRLLNVMFISAAATSFFAIMQGINPHFLQFWEDSSFRGRFYGTMGNPNFLATYLAMLAPLAIVQIWQNKNLLSASIGLILSITALFFTFSRGAWLGLIIGIIFLATILLLIATRRQSNNEILLSSRRNLWKLIAIFLAVIGLILTVNLLRSNIYVPQETFFNRVRITENNLQSIRTRLEIWPIAVRRILERPILGYGQETFAITFPGGATADRAHNEILDMAYQIGIPGMVAYLGFLLMLFYESLKKILKSGGENLLNQLGLLSGITALFVANQFEFSLTVHWVYFFAFTALLFQKIDSDSN